MEELLKEFEQYYLDNNIEDRIKTLKEHFKNNKLDGYHNELTNLMILHLNQFLKDKPINENIIKLILNIGKTII